MRRAPLPGPSPPQTAQARPFIQTCLHDWSSVMDQRQLPYKVVGEKLWRETSVTKTLKVGKDSPLYFGCKKSVLTQCCC